MLRFLLLVNGWSQPTARTVPPRARSPLALGPTVPPSVLLPVPPGGTVRKDSFARCRPPCGDAEEGVSGRNHINLGIPISSFFFLCFLLIHHESTPGWPPPCVSVTGDLHLTKHVCRTQESRALLEHHLTLNPPVVKIAFSVKFL